MNFEIFFIKNNNYSMLSTEWFLFKKIRASTVSGFREDLNLFTVSPAVENILSAGAEIAGIHKSDLATFARFGKQTLLSFHQTSGLTSLETTFSAK